MSVHQNALTFYLKRSVMYEKNYCSSCFGCYFSFFCGFFHALIKETSMTVSAEEGSKYNYGEALQKSMFFYQVQQAGDCRTGMKYHGELIQLRTTLFPAVGLTQAITLNSH